MKKLLAILVCSAKVSEAVILVDKVGAASAATATAVTVNAISPNPGDLIVIACYQNVNNTSTVTMSDSSGKDTYIQIGGYVSQTTTDRMGMFYAPSSKPLSGITCTWSGGISGTITMALYTISGMNNASPLDAFTSSTLASGTSVTSGSLTTTHNPDIILVAAGQAATGLTGITQAAPFINKPGDKLASGGIGMFYYIPPDLQSGLTTVLTYSGGTATEIDTIMASFLGAGTCQSSFCGVLGQ